MALVGAGCFNPNIKNGGFACSGSGDGQCPAGFFCIDNRCVQHPAPNLPGPSVDMTMTMASQDMSMPASTGGDMARVAPAPDMTPVALVDMATPPDMTPVNACAHSPCVTGTYLKASCSSCVMQFCTDNIFGDPYCCKSANKWDSICVSEYKGYGCDNSC